jgi:hypothetical protein
MLLATIYIVGFILAFGYIASDEIVHLDFASPFLAIGLLVGIFWPVFLIMAIVNAICTRDLSDIFGE